MEFGEAESAVRDSGAEAGAAADRQGLERWLAERTSQAPRAWSAGLAFFVVLGVVVTASVYDDAYISLRYAANIADGYGPVFNIGERVEGYTNPLWTALLVIPGSGLIPVRPFIVVVGAILAVIGVWMTRQLAMLRTGSSGQAWLAALLAAGTATFIAMAANGLETMLVAVLVTAIGVLVSEDEVTPARWTAIGVLTGLALLTRLDTAVLVAAWLVIALTERRLRSPSVLLVRFLPAVLIIVVPWAVWKFDYYGTLLPNTAGAKGDAPLLARVGFGLGFVLVFLASYLLPLVFRRDVWRTARLQQDPAVRSLYWVLGAWTLYVLWAGADFMEFRFMVPIIPVLAVVVARILVGLDERRSVRWLIAGMAFLSFLHLLNPVPIPIQTLRTLSMSDEGSDAYRFAETLRDTLGDEEDPPVIALSALGVTSYVTGFRSVDMLGLTDDEVVERGLSFDNYFPGHVQIAPIDLLVERDVDLVFGTPAPQDRVDDRQAWSVKELVFVYPGVDLTELPADATVVEIPWSQDEVVPVIRLGDSPVVGRAIRENGWRELPIDRDCGVPWPTDPVIQSTRAWFGTRTCS